MNALNTEACTNICSFLYLEGFVIYRESQNSLCIQQKNSQNDQLRYARTIIIPIAIIESLQKSFLMISVNPVLWWKKIKFRFFHIGYFELSDLHKYFEFLKSYYIFVIRKDWTFNSVKIKFLRHVEEKLIFFIFILLLQ